MSLGVSTTNEMEDRSAKSHLQDWLKYHPDYSQLLPAEDRPLDMVELRNLFDQAHAMKPQDTQVLMALGILTFIDRNYTSAAQVFQAAIKENPTDHSLWNKFGACCSNNMDLK